MDKNSVIGFSLIMLLLFGYIYINQPTQEQIEAHKRTQDSIAHAKDIEQIKAEQEALRRQEEKANLLAGSLANPDSLLQAPTQKEEFSVLENELVKITLSNKGGRIYSVELKNYKTFNKKPLILWEGATNKFGLDFTTKGHSISSQNLFFESSIPNDSTLLMRSKVAESGYIEYAYVLPKNSYEVDFDIKLHNFNPIVSGYSEQLAFTWQAALRSQEKSREFENSSSQLYYKELDKNTDYLSNSKDDEEKIENKLKWIAFKQQFFSSVLIGKTELAPAKLISTPFPEEDSTYLKKMEAQIPLPFAGKMDEVYQMKFYFGPNHYYTLREYGKDIQLHKLVDLGWGIFGWVNRFVVIPLFSFLENNVTQNYGIIILLLTIFIKLVLSPLTYRSYISSAKMRVLKPQIDEIHEKIPKEKAMERQQATMAMYKKAGVNPLGGCVPMLVQMPILFALFRFFPASIELRQKSFLWADDLSTYDSIYELPFRIAFYGDHVALFCLLMSVTNLVYTYINMQNQSSQQSMPGMKVMMYLMPVMFLGFFNNYASGLSYYYFIATLFTVIQTILIRKYMVDDEKILAKLEENKKKPAKPKSKFQQRLEAMQKQQMQQMQTQKKKKK